MAGIWGCQHYYHYDKLPPFGNVEVIIVAIFIRTLHSGKAAGSGKHHQHQQSHHHLFITIIIKIVIIIIVIIIIIIATLIRASVGHSGEGGRVRWHPNTSPGSTPHFQQWNISLPLDKSTKYTLFASNTFIDSFHDEVFQKHHALGKNLYIWSGTGFNIFTSSLIINRAVKLYQKPAGGRG